MKQIPVATYRLQFNRDFTFRQATALLEYLKELGVSDVYASPLFEAGAESTHGYDVCCFGKINRGIGNAEEFESFTAALRDRQLGLLLDIVPNHMSATTANEWWRDVLEHGRQSRFADFFDIDWEPSDPTLHNKVLLPVLEDHYGKVLESGKLRLEFKDGQFSIGYYANQFPIDPQTLPAAAKNNPEQFVNSINGRPGESRSFDELHALIQRQHYRPAYWRVATEEINYRRFFDVTSLAALRMERPDVFAATHQLVLDLIAQGTITGLRVDHPDGLRDPTRYFERLQSAFQELQSSPGFGEARNQWHEEANSITSNGSIATVTTMQESDAERLYVVAEKILSGDELLPKEWPVDGTTGYDFLNRINGLFVDSKNEVEFDRIYREFTGCNLDFQTIAHQSKKQILETVLVSELDSLTRSLREVAIHVRSGIDLTFTQLKRALTEIIAAFPVYRTYVTAESLEPSAQDRAVIEEALAHVKANEGLNQATLNFIEDILTLITFHELDDRAAALAREFILRFQQLTGPVMAKGLEDTAFYNYNRLISLNEVGGDPGKFGNSPGSFHNHAVKAVDHWPHTLLATATHDTKRGEDARSRINVLSEIPGEWHDALERWARFNSDKKILLHGKPAPTANDEYLLYQSLIGGWPINADPETFRNFRERLAAFILKAAREAKSNTSWLKPDQEYEKAIQQFVERILTDCGDNLFLDDFRKFQRRVSFFARFNSLAQTVLKLTAPGVPDLYQGTELWDFSFVDPDNRRPVDFALRQRILSDLKNRFDSTASNAPESIRDLVGQDRIGESKLYAIWKALALRQQLREVFDSGTHDPLPAFGKCKNHVVAFARRHNGKSIVTIVPRLVCGLTQEMETPPLGEEIWKETFLPIPNSRPGERFKNIFTGEIVTTVEGHGDSALLIADIFKNFPVAVLEN